MTDAALRVEEAAPVMATARAALYLRVSTGRQAESDLSLPDQRRQIKGYCLSLGWEVAAEPLTSQLLKPAFADAETSQVTEVRDQPGYLTVLSLSQPLHFGDYRGMPLKITWALLYLVTIAVRGSGIYFWVARLVSAG